MKNDSTVMMVLCPCCGEFKPLEEFSGSSCKQCELNDLFDELVEEDNHDLFRKYLEAFSLKGEDAPSNSST